ncbi:hypothetical protein DAPK24_039700 [Pichia kluyveri]|uniref:Uncharacterized protein n=1 Tax=Pichia kluyveri TaxID=36015 RepID=A0AAV5R783_PICKL|nr:hypothetical protein DAPK24_039700 [Pichia kluyveri]
MTFNNSVNYKDASEANYDDVTDTIGHSSSTGQLFKDTKIKLLFGMSPGIDFSFPDSGNFARYYLYFKQTLIKMDNSKNYAKVFQAFEKNDEDAYNKIDNNTLNEFTVIMLNSFKTAVGRRNFVNSVGVDYSGTMFAILEKMRYYHCGSRKTFLDVTDAFGVIKYGFNYNNVNAVKLLLSYIDCLSLFHPVKNSLSEEQKIDKFLAKMDPTFRGKLISYLFYSEVISTEDVFTVSKDVSTFSELLEFISQYENSVNQELKCKRLSNINIDQSITVFKNA